MAIIEISAYLTVQNQNFWLQGDDLVVSGLDGDSTVVGVENRMWVGKIDLTPMSQQQAMRARAFSDQLRGRLNLLRVAIVNTGTPSLASGPNAFLLESGYTAAEVAAGETYYDDDLGYTDGTGFALPAAVEPVVAADVAAGASVLQMSGLMGEKLAIGAFFSIADHLYRVAENLLGRITFNPPLRVAAAANARVEVTRPTVLVRLSKADGFRVVQEYCRHARAVSLDVMEAVRHA
jgi:hypothetical protein